MDYNGFLKDIKGGKLEKIYLCYGREGYLKNWITKEIKKRYVDEAFETLNFVHYDGREVDVDKIINACETLPFMADKKIVIIEDSPYITSNKGGDEEEKLNNYISSLSESTCLLFLINDEKVDKRKKIIKRIKKNGAIVELNKIGDKDLKKWVEKVFKKNKKKIGKRDIFYFIQAIGYLDYNNEKTLYDMENEIIKLCNYVGQRDVITKEDIDKNLTKTLENNIFKLLDAIGKKKPNVALRVFNEMILGNEPIPKIMFMIIRQIRILFMSKLLSEKGYSQGNIAKKIGVHPYAAQKAIDQSKNFSSQELEMVLKRCLKVDENIKKGKIDNKLAVETLIIEFAQ